MNRRRRANAGNPTLRRLSKPACTLSARACSSKSDGARLSPYIAFQTRRTAVFMSFSASVIISRGSTQYCQIPLPIGACKNAPTKSSKVSAMPRIAALAL